MNAKEARRWVNVLVANALRKEAAHVTTGKLGHKARQSDVAKVRKVMMQMAQRLHPQEQHVEPQARAPGASSGQDDIPEVSEGGGQP